MFQRFTSALLVSITILLTPLIGYGYGSAQMIPTEQALPNYENRAVLLSELAREDVRAELSKLGVNPDEAANRIASMSDEEVRQTVQSMTTATAGGEVIVIGGLTLLLLIIIIFKNNVQVRDMNSENADHSLRTWLPAYFSLLTALVATSGSLFFSEVMVLPPCVLCWYQRIAMYPLILIIGTGILVQDRRFSVYSVPLTVIGFIIAFYHNLLYYHIIPESLSPCVQGISCTSRQIEWLGFITIPLLSLMAFTLILIALYIFKKNVITKQRT